ncbi:phosphodiesterase [Peptoniphilus raoultii]|uniref:phosphodiesterase n=1 Tax=Peptoniphilus raoultii TaxID=1776387 RepID=UPI0008DB15A3|nr:phosphodiesterase [Peptoniphilus raoultii]
MKIGLISDSHGSYIQTKKALEALGKCDHIIHLGDVLYHGPRNPIFSTYEPAKLAEYLRDKNISYIRGNCDSDVDQMVTGKNLSHKERLFDFGDLKIYAVHGYEETLDERILRAYHLGANTVCFGHTHIKTLERHGDILVVNPGSISLSKDGPNTCTLYENGEWKFIEL